MAATSKTIIIPEVVARPPWMKAARPGGMASRNAGGMTTTTPAPQHLNPRRRFVPRASKVEVSAKQALAVTGGGVLGGAAVLGLAAAGVSPGWTMGGLAVAGAVGMYSLKGLPRDASAGLVGGAALMLGASLAARLFMKAAPKPQLPAGKPVPQAPALATPPRQDADGGMDLDEAFRNAREDEGGDEYDDR
ncbi:MAG: hypothetical protein IT370_21020 [Deltaproteobacteria bacterium]|nr:hypothetical protein [Deltaproteobacteria bacterium]